MRSLWVLSEGRLTAKRRGPTDRSVEWRDLSRRVRVHLAGRVERRAVGAQTWQWCAESADSAPIRKNPAESAPILRDQLIEGLPLALLVFSRAARSKRS